MILDCYQKVRAICFFLGKADALATYSKCEKNLNIIPGPCKIPVQVTTFSKRAGDTTVTAIRGQLRPSGTCLQKHSSSLVHSILHADISFPRKRWHQVKYCIYGLGLPPTPPRQKKNLQTGHMLLMLPPRFLCQVSMLLLNHRSSSGIVDKFSCKQKTYLLE